MKPQLSEFDLSQNLAQPLHPTGGRRPATLSAPSEISEQDIFQSYADQPTWHSISYTLGTVALQWISSGSKLLKQLFAWLQSQKNETFRKPGTFTVHFNEKRLKHPFQQPETLSLESALALRKIHSNLGSYKASTYHVSQRTPRVQIYRKDLNKSNPWLDSVKQQSEPVTYHDLQPEPAPTLSWRRGKKPGIQMSMSPEEYNLGLDDIFTTPVSNPFSEYDDLATLRQYILQIREMGRMAQQLAPKKAAPPMEATAPTRTKATKAATKQAQPAKPSAPTKRKPDSAPAMQRPAAPTAQAVQTQTSTQAVAQKRVSPQQPQASARPQASTGKSASQRPAQPGNPTSNQQSATVPQAPQQRPVTGRPAAPQTPVPNARPSIGNTTPQSIASAPGQPARPQGIPKTAPVKTGSTRPTAASVAEKTSRIAAQTTTPGTRQPAPTDNKSRAVTVPGNIRPPAGPTQSAPASRPQAAPHQAMAQRTAPQKPVTPQGKTPQASAPTQRVQTQTRPIPEAQQKTAATLASELATTYASAPKQPTTSPEAAAKKPALANPRSLIEEARARNLEIQQQMAAYREMINEIDGPDLIARNSRILHNSISNLANAYFQQAATED